MKKEEWERYRRQAEHALASARSDRAKGDHDWASFKAHQAAELAVKGYVRATLQYVTGHSVVRLLASPGLEPPASIVDCAKALAKVCIPARYPRCLRFWGAHGLLHGGRRRFGH